MKKYILFYIIIAILASCSDNDDDTNLICEVTDPIKNLEWLKNEVDQRESDTSNTSQYFYITQATYKAQTIIIYDNCCPNCNTVIPAYDCSGEFLGRINTDIPRNDIKGIKIIYRPKGFVCLTK